MDEMAAGDLDDLFQVPTLEMGSMTPDAQHLALMTNQKSLC